MDIAKIFMTGRNQAVRLPKECRFHENDDVVMLIPGDKVRKTFRNSFSKFSDNLLLERDNELP